jgi:WD40 repeat protein
MRTGRLSGGIDWRFGVLIGRVGRLGAFRLRRKRRRRREMFRCVFLLSSLLSPSPFLRYSPSQVLAALANNSLEVYHLPPPASSKALAVEPSKLLTLDLPGHRSDVRTLAVSSDDQLIASASHGSLKLWNVKTTKCVRTMNCGYAICCSFLPGDWHVRPSALFTSLFHPY